ncbi:SPOC domain-like protein [Butyriboletus roseoflavus]|nr:SPOC domain-like protein [Butyriboletus roseoflavus]
MFLVDLSPSMGASRTVELPDGPAGETRSVEMTKLEWSLQFVKMKIQEMIFNGRKTDQCGVITFGSEETRNVVNEKNGGYEHVSEYIPIGQPNAETLAKLDELQASETAGDPIDALIVGIETQDIYLEKKRTWTRKMVLVTDGESPMEIEEWEGIVKKISSLNIMLTIVGVDFDDEELAYQEEDKSPIKRVNETFYVRLITALPEGLGLLGSLEHALLTLTYPNIKETKSALLSTTLRLGDVEVRESEAIELNVRIAKCTSLARAASWKKYFKKGSDEDVPDVEDEGKDTYKEVKRRTEYVIDMSTEEEEDGKGPTAQDVSMDVDEEKGVPEEETRFEKVEKEQLIKGFKYGSTYVPCPDGQFERLNTKKGIEICGFFQRKNLNRSYLMGELSYVYASPTSIPDQLAFSSIVQAMYEKGVLAIARMVSREGLDPKMGVLSPIVWPNVDVLLWVQMPFADDVRRYTFPSLTTLISRSGEKLTKHPYIPTEEQLEAMDNFVDAMNLMEAGDKDEKGQVYKHDFHYPCGTQIGFPRSRQPWFDPRLSYNPAIHRTKQAQFHSAVVSDITTHPLPPPHPELTKYFDPPKRVLKTAKQALEECKAAFKVKEGTYYPTFIFASTPCFADHTAPSSVPKRAPKARRDDHMRAQDQDEDMILLDQKGPARKEPVVTTPSKSGAASASPSRAGKKKVSVDDSETESESDEEILWESKPKPSAPGLPTPTASPEPEPDPQRAPGRIIGNAYPLMDFRQNLKQGDVVTKAVEDFGVVVREIVGQPFASRRKDEMMKCLKELREACLRVSTWFELILKGLKEDCAGKNGNKDFWAELRKLGRDMSLISTTEARRFGGISAISESAVDVFMQQ